MSRRRTAVTKQRILTPDKKNSDRPPNILDGIFEVYNRSKSKKLLASATRTKLSGFFAEN